MPKLLKKYVRKQLNAAYKRKKKVNKVQSSPFPWTQAVNEYCAENRMFNVFMLLTDYTRTSLGWKRPGSSNNNNIVVHDDSWGMNFSNDDSQLLPCAKGSPQPFSAWDILVAVSSIKKAKKAVCNGAIDEWLRRLGYSSDIKNRVDALFSPKDYSHYKLGNLTDAKN